MSRVPNPIIESLADDLKPVSPMRMYSGVVLVALAALVAVLGVELIAGLWRGMLAGRASGFFYITYGLLGVLGAASTAAVLRMAGPRVGNRYDGPAWGATMVAVLPVAAVVTVLVQGSMHETLHDPYGLECMLASIAASGLTFAVLIMWLRRGAPVSLIPAGWMTGLAAGSLGTFAFGLACPIDDIGHLGIWHMAPVAICAVLGRLIVPTVVRW